MVHAGRWVPSVLIVNFAWLAPPALVAQAPPGTVAVHPDPAYVVRPIPPTDSIWLTHDTPGLTGVQWPSVPGASAVSFGSVDGPDDEIIGEVTDVAVTKDGRVLVLDETANRIQVVGRDGHLIAAFGRLGRGPGDFFHPRAMALDSRGRLYVADVARRIQRFTPDGESFRLDTVLTVRAAPRSICMLGDTIVTAARSAGDSTAIKLFTVNGRFIRGFGKVYDAPNEMANSYAADGFVACLPRTHEVAFISRTEVPELRIYGTDGRARRVTPILGFHPPLMYETDDGGMAFTYDQVRHGVVDLEALPDGTLLLQVEEFPADRAAAREGPAKRYSMLLDPLHRGALVRTDLPRIGAMAGSAAVTVVDDPAPMVSWHRTP